ncbi:hypothetical protein [Pontibacter beigongshangensis]|uniref:hypothetical protein n=1 Tax=Pontibacter beigongshangensis TaxID=2574733 RepID=UPI00164F99D8|nr:hypothetical protein [Pontibacter beigongshangensis]
MHHLTLKYQVKKKLQVVHQQVASTWNELTREQLLEIIRIQFSFKPDHMQKLLLLKTLLQVKWAILHQFTGVQRLGLYPILEFLEESTLTKQLLPALKLEDLVLHGPADRFRNITFAEFIYADTLFGFFTKTGKEAYLNKLIACLYRPQRLDYNPKSPTYKGDIREDFNEHLIGERAQLVASIPQPDKYAILTWYRGCRKELELIYDKVFTQTNQQKAAEGDWGDVLLSLSGEKFGHVEQTSQQRVHTIFKEIQRKAREHEELERRQKQQK